MPVIRTRSDKNSPKRLNDLLDHLDKQTSDLYRSTYYSNDISDTVYDDVMNDLDTAIRKATDGDQEYQNMSNVSKLLEKISAKDGITSTLIDNFGKNNDNDITNIFQNNEMVASLMDTYAKTKWITELDNEFDTICKYMPKLQIALDIKRDAVLCSDSYSKEFLTIKPMNEDPKSTTNASIQTNIEDMKKKYKLEENVETWYEDAAKYGEVFVYCVPYNVALGELLKRKKNTSYALTESNIRIGDIVPKNKLKASASIVYNESNNAPIIKITLDKSKVIGSIVENNYYLRKNSGDDELKGLSEMYNSYIEESDESFESHMKKSGDNIEIKFDKTIDDTLTWEDDSTSSDGLANSSNKEKDTKLNLNGAILKVIRHDRIIPVYIEDTMFGCYYFEYDEDESLDINANSSVQGYSSITSMFNNGIVSSNDRDIDKLNGDQILRTIAGKISQDIDAKFINANADLKKEIYLMLKYNDKYNQIDKTMLMNVTFIPADDIHHLKFRTDKETHRGISDLWDSLVAAKEWIVLNVTSILGWITRGFDRRVYYVKQSLDTNVAQSLLNVIATIKKGNFGIRQMESVNNILGVLGRFNDFVIPVGPNGDPPIQFDTQPGQDFNFPSELMQNLEESAVNEIVPIEIVNSSTGMDFAVRYTMTNAKLLRSVLKRQFIIETFCANLFNKIYKFEYGSSINLEVILPPPAFLSMTQGTQLLQNATQYADAIVDVEMYNESDEAKAMFKQRIIRKLAPTYLNDDEINSIKNQIKIDMSIKKSEPQDDNGGY